jgi:putative transposase
VTAVARSPHHQESLPEEAWPRQTEAMSTKLCPADHAERVALFRAQVLGPVLNRNLARGELTRELEQLSHRRFRPPGSDTTRSYSLQTLRRWYRSYSMGGLAALAPVSRVVGNALALDEGQRQLLLDIRREHPAVATTVMLETLQADGRLRPGQISAETVRRLLRRNGLPRKNKRRANQDLDGRRRWEAEHVGALWHADVCHGKTLCLDDRRIPVRIHALMDDKSRYVVALTALDHEREIGMLDLLVEAVRHYGAPKMLYLDNGSTYRGDALETVCGRLGINLVHANPYDPQARGKMERFWGTMRQGCLDHLGIVGSLHAIQVRLSAWLSERYHKREHASLMGRSPAKAWRERQLRVVEEAQLSLALTLRESRKVRTDCTLSVGGIDWETTERFLAGHAVTIARTLADPYRAPWIEREGTVYKLHPVDPVANGKLRRKPRVKKTGIDAVEFDPATVVLDVYFGRKKGGVQ